MNILYIYYIYVYSILPIHIVMGKYIYNVVYNIHIYNYIYMLSCIYSPYIYIYI